jgi:hypothetical protein
MQAACGVYGAQRAMLCFGTFLQLRSSSFLPDKVTALIQPQLTAAY